MKISIFQRFWANTYVTNDCWFWTGCMNGSGYGSIGAREVIMGAHVFSWELHNFKEVPLGKLVLHSCDIKQCVNPEHLFLGSLQDNMLDASGKGVLLGNAKPQTHCKRGHDLAEAYIYKGVRCCRKCSVIRQRKYNLERKNAVAL